MSLIAVATAKEYIKATSSDATQTALIQALLDGAEDVVARHCNTRFSVTAFTEMASGGVEYFAPAISPVVAVSAIYHLTSEYTYGATEYIVSDSRIYQALSGVIAAGRWPSGQYQITYTGGYASVPKGIELAILEMVARTWDNRGGMTSTGAGNAGTQSWGLVITPGSDLDVILSPYRRLAVGR